MLEPRLRSCLAMALSNECSKFSVIFVRWRSTSLRTAANSVVTWLLKSASFFSFVSALSFIWVIWLDSSSIFASCALNLCSMGASTCLGFAAARVLDGPDAFTTCMSWPPRYWAHGSWYGSPLLKVLTDALAPTPAFGICPATTGDDLDTTCWLTALTKMLCPFQLMNDRSCFSSLPINHMFAPRALIGRAVQPWPFSHSLTSVCFAAMGTGEILYKCLIAIFSGHGSWGFKIFHASLKSDVVKRMPLIVRTISPLGLEFRTMPRWLGWSTAVLANSMDVCSNQMIWKRVSNWWSSPLGTTKTPFIPDFLIQDSNLFWGIRVWHWKLKASCGSHFPFWLIHERPHGGETMLDSSSIPKASIAKRTGWSTQDFQSCTPTSSLYIVIAMMELDAMMTSSAGLDLSLTFFMPKLRRQHCNTAGCPFGPRALTCTGLHSDGFLDGQSCPRTTIASSSWDIILKSSSHCRATSLSTSATPAVLGAMSWRIVHTEPSSLTKFSEINLKDSALMVCLCPAFFFAAAFWISLFDSFSSFGKFGHWICKDLDICCIALILSSSSGIDIKRWIATTPALLVTTSAKCEVCCKSAPFDKRNTAMEFLVVMISSVLLPPPRSPVIRCILRISCWSCNATWRKTLKGTSIFAFCPRMIARKGTSNFIVSHTLSHKRIKSLGHPSSWYQPSHITKFHSLIRR